MNDTKINFTFLRVTTVWPNGIRPPIDSMSIFLTASDKAKDDYFSTHWSYVFSMKKTSKLLRDTKQKKCKTVSSTTILMY